MSLRVGTEHPPHLFARLSQPQRWPRRREHIDTIPRLEVFGEVCVDEVVERLADSASTRGRLESGTCRRVRTGDATAEGLIG